MKILFVSSEVAPFEKTGGLADVAGALPIALAQLGMDIRVAMPGYSTITYPGNGSLPVLPFMDVQVGSETYAANVSAGNLPGSPVPVYFIHNAALFNRNGLYQENGKDYPDNAQRFAFFCRAVLWLIKGLNWTPDIIHCNDWPTALLPIFLRTDPAVQDDADLNAIKTVYTIHNLAYQGLFPPETAAAIGLAPELVTPSSMEFWGSISFMKGSLLLSDILTTVSPTYAKEIQTQEFGCGLDGVLRDRASDLYGILNGIDYSQWNPEVDSFIPALYSSEDMAGKIQCKAELQKELGLKEAPQVPLLVVISRLDPQKGLDILLPLIPRLMEENLQLAILGTGMPEYEKAIAADAAKHKGRMAAIMKFNNALAHKMEAGADMFLMPSQFEPCGLNQLYSLRYGTLPVVRRTGGLADSVEQITDDSSAGSGFIFDEYTSKALLAAIHQALALYNDTDSWRRAQIRAMEQDFSWTASAKRYGDLYSKLL